MNGPLKFPNDSNGDALRRMHAAGDDLSKPRNIDFCFIFSTRSQALAFAGIIDDQSTEICILFYEGRGTWQAIVKRRMVPEYAAITDTEASLSAEARRHEGKFDGWGSITIPATDALMTIEEARKIIRDNASDFVQWTCAAGALTSSPISSFDDLLACLNRRGLPAEMAATKLYVRTKRPRPDNSVDSIVLDHDDWSKWLKNHKYI